MHVSLVAHHGGSVLLGLEVVPVLLQLATLLHLHHLALQCMHEAPSQRSHSMLIHTAKLTLLMGAYGKKAAAECLVFQQHIGSAGCICHECAGGREGLICMR